jgi:hypothetical protein
MTIHTRRRLFNKAAEKTWKSRNGKQLMNNGLIKAGRSVQLLSNEQNEAKDLCNVTFPNIASELLNRRHKNLQHEAEYIIQYKIFKGTLP